uniref:Uncharacterized protein n=1 Tax=Romanomermis culicivorax TaxID=13658 RepID=A0A915J635_ROMCU
MLAVLYGKDEFRSVSEGQNRFLQLIAQKMSHSHKDDEDDFFSADEGSQDEDLEIEDQTQDLITNDSIDVKCETKEKTSDAIHDESESKTLVADILDTKVEKMPIVEDPSKTDEEEDWVQFPERSKTEIPSSTMNENKNQESPPETAIQNDEKKSWFGDWNSILSNASRIGSSVLESVESTLGAPSPEELAKITSKNEQKVKFETQEEQETSVDTCQDDKKIDLGDLLQNVTHLFENTGRTLIAGSLDVMENIGKTSFNVLTEPSTSSENDSRRKFRFQPSDKPNLSQVLREARQKTEVEQAGWGWDDEKPDLETENSKLKIPKFDDYFEKFNGNVHLDALKMFSESQDMQISSILESLTNEKRRILNFKLQKLIAKFDEILSDDYSTSDDEYQDFVTNFNELWAKLGVKVYKCGRLTDIYKKHGKILSGLDGEEEDPVIIMQKSMDFFGEFASAIVETFLKVGQLLTVEKRPPEIICLAKITKLLVHEINEKAVNYSSLLEMCSKKVENEPDISYLTDLFVEATNCSICVKESSNLLIPIMKILYFESSFPCTD